jgi:16S rRNA (cytosine967-C5)-methyltransferase
LANAREIAYELLQRVATTDSYINLLLPSVLRGSNLSDPDRGMVQELSYGALRWQAQYDAMIDLLSDNSPSVEVRNLLRLGLHQLFRMRVPSHAAVSETVNLAKKLQSRAAGYVNAVLRNADRRGYEGLLESCLSGLDSFDRLAILYSHPRWVVAELAGALELDGRSGELEQLLAANNETPEVNLAALTEADRSHLEGLGLEKAGLLPTAFKLVGNPEPLLTETIRVQDQGSQLVSRLLAKIADRDGCWVDMCSGPGGKAAILQAEISDASNLDCYEPASHRAELVREALGKGSKANVVVSQGQAIPKQSYDGVLLDAPCSGLGSLRRKPESRWRKTKKQLADLRKIQRELLEAGIDGLKSGGILVYSTCSPVVSETNDQVAWLLEKRKDIELVDISAELTALSPGIELNQNRKSVQLWTHVHASDAMFIAALRKK